MVIFTHQSIYFGLSLELSIPKLLREVVDEQVATLWSCTETDRWTDRGEKEMMGREKKGLASGRKEAGYPNVLQYSASCPFGFCSKDVQTCSSQTSIFEISPTFMQTLPIHISLIHFSMNKSKRRAFYLHTTLLFVGKSDSRRGKRSLTPSFIISDSPQLQLLLNVLTPPPPRGEGVGGAALREDTTRGQ